jgi:hypothetical protein
MFPRKLEAETLALFVLEANDWENQETKAALLILETARNMPVGECSIYCANQMLAGEESQRT